MAMTSTNGDTWWTFEEVQAYLGHARANSSEVWMTRHGIKSVLMYPADEIVAERGGEGITKGRRGR